MTKPISNRGERIAAETRPRMPQRSSGLTARIGVRKLPGRIISRSVIRLLEDKTMRHALANQDRHDVRVLDDEARWAAFICRDAAFDGIFYACVETTSI